MVKYIFSLVALILTLSATSQRVMKVKRKGVEPIVITKAPEKPDYSLDQFKGRWQEISRKDLKTNTAVQFKDTLSYLFSGDNQVYNRDGVNMSLIGEADIDPGNVLTAAADVFTIRSFNGRQMVLDDGEYIHTLIRKDRFWNETLPTNSIIPEKYTTPVSVTSSALFGKWKVYRRDAKPGTKSGDLLIRMLNITSSPDEHTAGGEIIFYQSNKFTTLPCTITLSGEKMHISTQSHTWNSNVYKADGKYLVFGDPSLMYYCKRVEL